MNMSCQSAVTLARAVSQRLPINCGSSKYAEAHFLRLTASDGALDSILPCIHHSPWLRALMMGPTDGHQPSASIPLLADAIALSRHREQFSTNISHIKCPTPLQGSIRMPERLPSEMVPPMLDLPNRSLPQCYVNEHFGPEVFHIYNIGPACLFNKIRTDTKHRKRAFTKRGYFRQSRSILRKENRMKFAYALQGIDYEMLESLKMGEIPDIRDYKR